MDYHDDAKGIICAVSTPEGRSAIAVIRVSGSGSASVVEHLMGLEKGRLRGMRRKTGVIRRAGVELDSVVALGWPEGSSYTGEEMVEIMCHGIPEVTADILECLMDAGARKAVPGEFTRRAFMSGRMSAWQVMSLASMWRGMDHGNRLSGEGGSECSRLLRETRRVRELLEADIEFQEEHGTGGSEDLLAEFGSLMELTGEFRRKTSVMEGECRVMLMGPVNSGKSTLFNRIAGGEAALVSDEPGTTRDGASVHVEIRGRRILVCDTAGSDGTGIDREAYRRALGTMKGTDGVIWMSVGGTEKTPGEIEKTAGWIIRVSSKSDLVEKCTDKEWLGVSCVTGEGIDELQELVSQFPGSMSVTALADRIENRVGAARDSVIEGDFAVASENLADAENELSDLLDRGSCALISVERALSGMCVGK
ncbi:MAG: hypothetical protein AVO35_01525 [Candidatus Aegiribacteria sp. MLS_C]|nr:MAG: hypothetical protein AVO35_01525 [Candidatus Aegiribacteria sp. MLS_C]